MQRLTTDRPGGSRRLPSRHVRNLAASIAVLLGSLVCSSISNAQSLLVSSRFSDNVLRYDGESGDFIEVFADGGGLINAIGMDFGPDGHVYVASGDLPLVNKYHRWTGDFIEQFVFDDPRTEKDETGGLSSPRGLLFGPDGDLYVAGGGSDQVHVYDGETGDFVRIAAAGGGLDGPIDVAFDDKGRIYVTSALTHEVLLYDVETGEFIDEFVCPGDGGLNNPTGLLFGPDGHLYVCSAVTHQVLRFNGESGDFIDKFAFDGPLNVPIDLEFGPDGHLYVGSFETNEVLLYNGRNGDFIESFASGGGLDGTHFLLFVPQTGDLDADGAVGSGDLIQLLGAWGPCDDCSDCLADLDGNCTVGTTDLLTLLGNWG